MGNKFKGIVRVKDKATYESLESIDQDKLYVVEEEVEDPTVLVLGVKGGAETEYRTGNVTITKANIGLGNVDNTSDLNKPISTATQTALNAKQNTLTAGNAFSLDNNVAAVKSDNKTLTLDSNGNLQTAVGGYVESGSSVTLIDGGYTQEYETKWVSVNAVSASNWNTYFSGKDSVSVNLTGSVTINGTAHTLSGAYTFTSTEGGNAFTCLIDEDTYTYIVFWGPNGESGEATAYKVMFKGNGAMTNISLVATTASETVHQIDSRFIPSDSTKLDKVSTASKVYGTDSNGDQTTYNVDSFGQVDDVQAEGVSVVTNKVANVTKASLGLGNVDNTSDANKPVSTAAQTALDLKENLSNKTTSLSSSSTDTQYPSAKAVYDAIEGSTGAAWGSITGTLSSQTDLQTALNAKVNTSDNISTSKLEEIFGTGTGTSSWATQEYVDTSVSTVSNRQKIYSETLTNGNFNQLIDISTFTTKTVNGITFTNNGDGSLTVTGTATATFDQEIIKVTVSYGHKYIISNSGVSMPMSSLSSYNIHIYGQTAVLGGIDESNRTNYAMLEAYGSASTTECQIGINCTSGSTYNYTIYPMFFDTTQIYGVGKEPTTTQEFMADFGLLYYPYTTGTKYEEFANKVTSISSSSTDTEYPSAKCVYDNLATKQANIGVNPATTTSTLTGLTINGTSYKIESGSATAGVTSIGEKTGAITLGDALYMWGNQLTSRIYYHQITIEVGSDQIVYATLVSSDNMTMTYETVVYILSTQIPSHQIFVHGNALDSSQGISAPVLMLKYDVDSEELLLTITQSGQTADITIPSTATFTDTVVYI